MMNNVVRFGGLALIALGALGVLLKLVLGETFEVLSLDAGAMLLAGGFVTLALGSLTAAVETLRAVVAGEAQGVEDFEDQVAPAPSYAQGLGAAAAPMRPRGNSHGLAALQEPEVASRPLDRPKSPDERISIVKDHPHPTIETAAEEVHEFDATPPADDAISEEELYVVEERTIAGKPARVLSDGTVEAETDEGWMRFENVEHLEEYIEAVRAERG
jgi:hypothetical protein